MIIYKQNKTYIVEVQSIIFNTKLEYNLKLKRNVDHKVTMVTNINIYLCINTKQIITNYAHTQIIHNL